ncbi:hypothetical protein LJC30_02730 [Odoribacter sp. OttesenSCG-928-L07]|nr:hypothetical protein [Odoribacter sp. OttesenSCG-928-L07]MDL2238946.1 hypothetical protein [Bacteroidales bacterium OttesenSCG-928-L14]
MSIKNGENYEIVIENKVKSFPNLSQLEEYRSKICQKQSESCKYVLLSLFTTTKKTDVWRKQSYKDLANALEAKINVFVTDGYCKNIIEDYIRFIKNLDEICKLTKIDEKEVYDYNNSDLYKILEKEIRFGDFYLKAKYAQICEKISDILEDEKIFYKQDFSIKQIMDGKEKIKTLYVNHGFSRADGIIEVKIKTKGFVYLIQVQGNLYKRGFESYNTRMPPKNISNEVKNWVNFNDISKKGVVFPVDNEKEYNKYGDSFKYKNIKISETEYIYTKKLIELIIKDTKQCLEFIDK